MVPSKGFEPLTFRFATGLRRMGMGVFWCSKGLSNSCEDTRMRDTRRKKLSFRIFILILLPSLSSGYEVENIQNGVVKIIAETASGEQRAGAGTIVEIGNDFAIVVTASAVVGGARKLTATSLSSPDVSMPATVIEMEGADPRGLAALLVEGAMPSGAVPLVLAHQAPVNIGDPIITPDTRRNGDSWAVVEGKIEAREGRVLRFSLDRALTHSGGPLIKDGQVIGVVTEVKGKSAYASPAGIAAYVLASWGVIDTQRTDLADLLIAESVALLLQVRHRSRKERRDYWVNLIRQEQRAELLRRSLLLAAESFRRSPSARAKWALRSGLVLLSSPVLETAAARAFAFSPDGRYLATTWSSGSGKDDLGGAARLWDIATGKEVARYWHETHVQAVAFSPDGRSLATGTETGMVFLWALETDQQVTKLAHDDPVTSITYSTDGRLLLTTTRKEGVEQIHAWYVSSLTRRFNSSLRNYESIALGPNGRYLAAMSSSMRSPGILRLVELTTGKEKGHMQSKGALSGIAFSADGQFVAAAFVDENTRVWSVPEEREVFKIPYSGRSLAFSLDSRYLVIGGSLWDLTQSSEQGQLLTEDKVHALPHEDTIFDVAFSPDGRYVATGSQDGTARVWSVSNGEELARLTHTSNVYEVRFSPDSQYLASRDQNGITKVWRLWPEDLVSEACRRVERNLTPEEWRRYLGDEPYRRTCETNLETVR